MMRRLLLLGWFFYAVLSDGGGTVIEVRRAGLFSSEMVSELACEETRVALRKRLSVSETQVNQVPQVSARCVNDSPEVR